uniref:polynucleotide adenylyltransferase n=1 Tax=Branchiostoma floridae TaxID=7739 RepID=C3Y1Z0_BRAFL|eukprot:XP_002609870.1 hypothetical protein BRAFLDRAFT_90748 [Branchiostoma floridae]
MYSNIQAPPFPYNPLVLQAMHAQLSRPPPTPRELIALELNMRHQNYYWLSIVASIHVAKAKRAISSTSAFIQRPQLIRAKVPILKFKDSVSGVECDVNINNLTGVRNTFLLQAYSRLDWRIRPLVFLVKLWAGAQGINDASQSTLSSYSLTLMTLHYLQVDWRIRPLVFLVKLWAGAQGINDASQSTLSSYSLTLMTLHYLQVGCSAPVIPSIQRDYPELFALHLTVEQLEANVSRVPPYKTANTQSPAELLKGMLNYYTNVFDFEEEVISVRLGIKLRKSGLQDDREWREKFISIEEPFDQSNTARAVYQYPKFELIKRAFSKGYKTLQTTDNLDDLLCKCDP